MRLNAGCKGHEDDEQNFLYDSKDFIRSRANSKPSQALIPTGDRPFRTHYYILVARYRTSMHIYSSRPSTAAKASTFTDRTFLSPNLFVHIHLQLYRHAATPRRRLLVAKDRQDRPSKLTFRVSTTAPSKSSALRLRPIQQQAFCLARLLPHAPVWALQRIVSNSIVSIYPESFRVTNPPIPDTRSGAYLSEDVLYSELCPPFAT